MFGETGRLKPESDPMAIKHTLAPLPLLMLLLPPPPLVAVVLVVDVLVVYVVVVVVVCSGSGAEGRVAACAGRGAVLLTQNAFRHEPFATSFTASQCQYFMPSVSP